MSTPEDTTVRQPGIRRSMQIAMRYERGASLAWLASQYGVSKQRVKVMLVGMQVPLRGRGRPRKVNGKPLHGIGEPHIGA